MAAVDPIVRLGRRGILAWSVSGVLARLTKRQSSSSDLVLTLPPLVTMAATTADYIRARVSKRGQLAEGQAYAGYSTRKGFRPISAKYAKELALSRRYYKSSAEFHAAAGAVPGRFSVTGGMWKGVQSRGTGRRAAIIDFAGSSVAARGRVEYRKLGGLKFAIPVVASGNIRNQTKAGAIASSLGISLLQPRRDEEIALQEAVNVAVDNHITQLWTLRAGARSGTQDNDLGGDKVLLNRVLAVWLQRGG